MAIIEKISFKVDGKWNEYDDLTISASMFEESKRGISFISSEGSKKLIDDELKGFCHNRFKGNFVLNDIDLKQLTLGQTLGLGSAIIKVIRIGKDCHKSCPIIERTNRACSLNKYIFFGEIVHEGLVSVNDEIKL